MRKSERPTVPPSFDVAKFARDSDAQIARVSERVPAREEPPAAPRSEVRIATRPTIGQAPTDEAWARTAVGRPAVALPPDRVMRLPLDHRAGFLLSLMDGSIDLDTIVEVPAMPREDVVRFVRDLFESGVVVFR